MKKNIYFYTNLLAWGLVLFLIGNYVFGWTTPSDDPPSSNLPAPINVGSTEQTKTGGLNIATESGSVGIGTTTPNNLIQVTGLVNFNNTKESTSLGYQAGKVNAGYYNSFVGYQAGYSNTGSDNTALGNSSLYSNASGERNTAVGSYSLYFSNGTYNNTAVGAYSLYSNTWGEYNTAVGESALNSNTTASNNTAVGMSALVLNTEGESNTAVGSGSLRMNTTGFDNSAMGEGALYHNTIGEYNTAMGSGSLHSNTTGINNTAMGAWALNYNTEGMDNSAMGEGALYNNTIGSGNSGMGEAALVGNSTGSWNTAMGAYGLFANDIGNYNTAVGYRAGWQNKGSNNILIGYAVADALKTGSTNIVIGYDIDLPTISSSNMLDIGNLIYATGLTSTSTTVSTGSVGIGTTGPASKLDILGTGTFGAAGVSALTSRAHTVTLSGADPTTYATFDANSIGRMTLAGTNLNQTVTNAASLAIVGAPVKSTNVALTNTHGLLIRAGAVSTATNSYGLTVNAQTGATNNYAAAFLGGNVGIGTSTPNNLLSVYQLIDFNNTDYNTKLGYQAGKNIVSGAQTNTFVGYQTGLASSTGSTLEADCNTGMGYQTLYSNTTGRENTAMGIQALKSNTTGSNNLAIGSYALFYNTTGSYNSTIGFNALERNTTGSYNAAVGYLAGDFSSTSNNATSSYSTYLGHDTRALASGDTNEIVIGSGATGVGSNSVVLGNDSITKTILKGNVGIGRIPTANKLEVEGNASKTTAGDWLANSDIRIKTDIQDLENALDVINALRPVKFRYTDEYRAKHESIEDRYYYNFIAQEFQEVFPDSVQEGGEGYLQLDTYVVRPYLVAAIQAQQKQIEDLKAELEGLKAQLNLGQ